MYLLWKNGEYTLADIGSYLQVEYTTVSNALTRGLRALKRDRKLRRQLQDGALDGQRILYSETEQWKTQS